MSVAEMALAFGLAGGALVATSLGLLARHVDHRLDALQQLARETRRELHHLQGQQGRHRADEQRYRSAIALERIRRNRADGDALDAARARRLRHARRSSATLDR